VRYNFDCLNNLYCAPNKIFEYGSFGIPILANDVPGLQETVRRYSAGLCVNAQESDLSEALDRIEGHYDFFSSRSRQMYDHAAMSEMPDGVGQTLAGCR
jgi:glycosyltransferase involved in cell wall biosynthesis